ncbi:hypothetical protein CKO42_18255 [Lamprobacter modestohalophilus]|uniref:Uncharacterized protein n=1 Tax=Lamprobacter modestohalophilus TaxID=1064514 RepID=A0A9X0WBD2_9GAMM|nr:hypothetical protein [Lamprobacter modestohalophilus]
MHEQQIALLAGETPERLLDARQQRHLNWRKRLLGVVDTETGAPSGRVFSIALDGALTLMFQVKSLSPQWYFHCYLHRDSQQFMRFNRSRSKQVFYGCVMPRNASNQRSGLLADIHLIREGLTELTIVHESVHAAAHLAFVLGVADAKALAAPYMCGSESARVWREEIQCRTVELCCKQILLNLRALSVEAVPMVDASIT